jgi:hypothetical protein
LRAIGRQRVDPGAGAFALVARAALDFLLDFELQAF